MFTRCLTIALMGCGSTSLGQTLLREKLPADAVTTVEVAVNLDGEMTLPGAKPQRLAVVGTSQLNYVERALPAEDAQKLLRIYKTIDIRRTVGDRKQTADIRKDVRRLVVLRSNNVKSPFSPDGPLLWSEIDVVKNDLFAPALADGLLPGKEVKPGDSWNATASAVRELTDLEKVSVGALVVKLVGVVTFDGKSRARLSVSGSLRGVDDNGPAKHTLDGTAYVDLDTSLLSYLSVKGTHELLDGEGRTNGRIDGRFTMTRKLTPSEALSDAAIAKLGVKPTPENTRLLYLNDELGVRFVHSRRWRVGAVQGKQVTLDGPNGAGLLITMEDRKSLPTAEAFLKETQNFIAQEKGTVANVTPPKRVRTSPATDRFEFDANLGKEQLHLVYAVIAGKEGGATLAARLPRADAKALSADVDAVLKEIELKK